MILVRSIVFDGVSVPPKIMDPFKEHLQIDYDDHYDSYDCPTYRCLNLKLLIMIFQCLFYHNVLKH